ncbi:MAG: undecaprenyl-diphosphate phosphatase [Rectinemataceae bacterium]
MSIAIVFVLALVQGAAELLPVSSSAHVIIVEKLFGLDPTSPQLTFLLVMLHTGTMFAVLVYFWPSWSKLLSRSNRDRGNFVKSVIIATIATGLVGLGLQYLIERLVLGGVRGAAVEDLFGNLWIISTGLALVGILIIVGGLTGSRPGESKAGANMKPWTAVLIGAVQGLALPFRGFSRSGSTISVGLLAGLNRWRAEVFSFALAFVLTIPVVAREALRLRNIAPSAAPGSDHRALVNGIVGMILSFAAGSLAIRWLSAWLEKGRWSLFGLYCIALSITLFVFAFRGL